jgi:DNA-binding transcriptional ArsR family regulator
MNSVDRKVFSHPTRVRILAMLGVAPANAAELACNLSQSIGKIAYHLSVLSRAEYIETAYGEEPDSPDPRYESLRI